jgi:hypothetical protein
VLRRILLPIAILLAAASTPTALQTLASHRVAYNPATCCPASSGAPATHSPHSQLPDAHMRGASDGATVPPQSWDHLAARHPLAGSQLESSHVRCAGAPRLTPVRHDPPYLRSFVLLI